MKINLKEVSKFLSGAFFVTAGASWYFWGIGLSVPFFATTMSAEFLGIRGFLHLGLFALTFWYGFLRKSKVARK